MCMHIVLDLLGKCVKEILFAILIDVGRNPRSFDGLCLPEFILLVMA